MKDESWRGLRLVLAGCVLLISAACQTPERRSALQRMDQLQADNSALKARAETDVAQSKMDMARQRQDDLRMIESLNRRFDELSQKLDALKSAPPKAVNDGGQPAPAPEPPKADPAVAAELERVRKETQEQLARMEEAVAKAQAQAEAARLAAEAAAKRPEDVKKETSLKGAKLPLTKFIDSSGKLVDLSQYVGKKIVVLSVMKGFYSQGICIYCTRQTSELAKNIQAFRDLNAEVLVVYPGKEEHINAFVKTVRDHEKSQDARYQLPFKVLLDVNQDAVRALNIAGDLANPTSFVIDKDATVRYQYVGRTISDRPSAAALLDEVKKLGDAKP